MYSIMTFITGILIVTMFAIPLIGQNADRHVRESKVRIGNFLVYRDAVREFMTKNPGFDGPVSASVLDLPGTFNNLGWSCEVNVGTAWVYGNMLPGGLRDAIEQMDQPINIGVKQSGTLVSPVYGDTGISVPNFVNEGQVVAVVKNI